MRKGDEVLFKVTIKDWFFVGVIEAGTIATVGELSDGWRTFIVNNEEISIGKHLLTEDVYVNLTRRNNKRKRVIKGI